MVYVDKPLTDNPMKGILMLRDLNTKYPNNADVNIQLAKLAIRTGQFDKAVERLEKALALSPQTLSINCLLAEAYNGNGNIEKAKVAMQKCKN
ncbi:MAG: tetratricopeptide repeat protein [Saprospiraceae bacterium]|nr:tetratricopeptide repeat protein [Saprospiraceae bacterium]